MLGSSVGAEVPWDRYGGLSRGWPKHGADRRLGQLSPRVTWQNAAMDPITALEQELRVLIRRAQSKGTVMAHLVHPELDASAFPLMAHIYENPGTRGSDLAAHFGVGRATVSRQLARLESLGLITRTVDPDDTRGQLISLTEEGHKRLHQARTARVHALAEALKDWDPNAIQMLAELLHRYSHSFAAWVEQHPDYV